MTNALSAEYIACHPECGYRGLIGAGGIGGGMMFSLEGDRTLGRNESRPARLLDSRDYCKLHIIAHYVAVLMGSAGGSGFHVLPVGRVGNDGRGLELLNEMAAVGMDNRAVSFAEGRPTTLSICFQYPDGSGSNITCTNSASAAVMPEDVDRAVALLIHPCREYAAVAVPEVPLETRFHFLRAARKLGCFTATNFASSEMEAALSSRVLECVDLLAINQDELEALIGRSVAPDIPGPVLARCAAVVRKFRPDMRILVTMGERGAFGFERGQWHYCPALNVDPVSTAGAGDALLGAAISALAAGAPLAAGGMERRTFEERPVESALDFGVLVAGLKTLSPHTINPDINTGAVVRYAAGRGIPFTGALAAAIRSR